jgi:phospholipid-binding lipoprotein MlaA
MNTGNPRHLAALLAASFLLGSPLAARGAASDAGAAVSPPPPFAESTLPSAVALDNTGASPPAPGAVTDNAAATPPTAEAAADNAAVSPPAADTAADNAAATPPTAEGAADNEAASPPAPGAATDNAAATPPSVEGAADNAAVSPPAAGEGEEGMREPSFAEESPPAPKVADPLEPVNRGIFYFNDKLYRWVLKPVAKGYSYAVPEGVRIAVRNFFFNIATPIRAVNALLQGKFKAAGTELARFGLNTMVGFGGFFDAAKAWNLPRADEDTGQTFGVWGIGNGFYLMLPFLGPSTARDTVGIVGDTFLDPTTYVLRPVYAIGTRVIRSENDLSFRLNQYEELTGGAVDPYVAVRDAYLQYRANLVRK